ncbi:MAG: hypothetical protein ACOYOH_00400 [Paracraurococcus sp.]|jgi:hypothetical protein
MAKGQKRNSREAKKPKSAKKPASGAAPSAFAQPPAPLPHKAAKRDA